MALKSIDDVDDYGVDDEISSIEIDNLAKNFRHVLRNNNKRARNRNYVDTKNVKKNGTQKKSFEKSKNKFVQSSNNSKVNSVLVVRGMVTLGQNVLLT